MAYAMPRPSAPDVGTFLDNADPGRTLSQHLQHAVPAAQRLCLCTGYVSGQGLAVSGRVAGPAGSASRGPAADWDAAHRLEVPTLYRHGRRHLHPPTPRGRRRAPGPGGVAASGRPGRGRPVGAALAGPVPRHARQTLSLADGSRPLAGSQWQLQSDPFRAHRPR